MDIPVVRQSLRQKLETIVGERSPASGQRHLAAVEAFIESEFQRYGLKVERDVFVYRGRHFHNIIGSLNASPKGPPVILGAHFDAVENTPGADDNASGVAVLLETARILAQAKLRMPLHCCAFNLEEWNMIGSTHFARKLKAAGVKLAAMISLEMVGYIDARQGRHKFACRSLPNDRVGLVTFSSPDRLKK
ncbi:MAG TPA: M28 family peptidase [Terriglobales bacterium]|nr:M28 family peptidase [Terriglobales bacterium]